MWSCLQPADVKVCRQLQLPWQSRCPCYHASTLKMEPRGLALGSWGCLCFSSLSCPTSSLIALSSNFCMCVLIPIYTQFDKFVLSKHHCSTSTWRRQYQSYHPWGVPGVPWHSYILADQLTLISTRRTRLCPPHYYWHLRIFRTSYVPEYQQRERECQRHRTTC